MSSTAAHPENLVLQATHVAVVSGRWTSPDTWQNGRVPHQGSRVLIPEGIQVEIDAKLRPSLTWIRVHGELSFSTDVNTELRVDTLVTAPGSRLEIGTPQQPVRSDVSAQIVFADLGPLDIR